MQRFGMLFLCLLLSVSLAACTDDPAEADTASPSAAHAVTEIHPADDTPADSCSITDTCVTTDACGTAGITVTPPETLPQLPDIPPPQETDAAASPNEQTITDDTAGTGDPRTTAAETVSAAPSSDALPADTNHTHSVETNFPETEPLHTVGETAAETVPSGDIELPIIDF